MWWGLKPFSSATLNIALGCASMTILHYFYRILFRHKFSLIYQREQLKEAFSVCDYYGILMSCQQSIVGNDRPVITRTLVSREDLDSNHRLNCPLSLRNGPTVWNIIIGNLRVFVKVSKYSLMTCSVHWTQHILNSVSYVVQSSVSTTITYLTPSKKLCFVTSISLRASSLISPTAYVQLHRYDGPCMVEPLYQHNIAFLEHSVSEGFHVLPHR